MKAKLQNYMKIKKLLFFAKQTFLNEKGQEIIPTLEGLVEFKKVFNNVSHLLDEIEDEIVKGKDEVEYFGGPISV